LLVIVFISYLQTIDAYPHGGGSYTVASENLGANAGLLYNSVVFISPRPSASRFAIFTLACPRPHRILWAGEAAFT
jgi:hypothetical protein